MRTLRNISFVLMFLLFPITLISQWVKTNGPNGGPFMSIIASGNYVYAGSYNYGIFRSSNNGASWSPCGLNALRYTIRSFADTESMIFAGTAGEGVYRSGNNGQDWVLSGLNYRYVNALAVSPMMVYAGTDNGVFVSTDNGSEWSQSGLTVSTTSIAASGSTVFAGGSAIYRSTNAGSNWTLINNGFTGAGVYSLAIAGSIIFAGTGGNGVYVSTDNGEDWNAANNGLLNLYIHSLCVSGNVVYAATDNGVYATTDNGQNWQSRSSGLTGAVINAITVSQGNLYAGTGGNGYGVCKSTNEGANWYQIGVPILTTFALLSKESKLYAGTNGVGLSVTTDNGESWRSMSSSVFGNNVLSLISYDSIFCIGNTIGFFYSSNNGVSWTKRNNGLTNSSLKALVKKGQNIIAGTNSGGLYITANEGMNWTQTQVSNKRINCLYLYGNYIFAGSDLDSGAFLSSDNGMTWTQINNGLTDKSIYSFSSAGGFVFAGTGDGVYKTSNNGSTWLSAGLSGKYCLSLTSYNNNIFAGAYNTYSSVSEIYSSGDYGFNWVKRNEGLINPGQVQSLTVSGSYLFAGISTQSVWRRPLQELVNVEVVGSEIPLKFWLHQNFPNPFNPVTKISFEVPKNSNVCIKIFDVSGKEIETLLNENLKAGMYEIIWNAVNRTSGVYFCKLTAEEFSATKKMVLLK